MLILIKKMKTRAVIRWILLVETVQFIMLRTLMWSTIWVVRIIIWDKKNFKAQGICLTATKIIIVTIIIITFIMMKVARILLGELMRLMRVRSLSTIICSSTIFKEMLVAGIVWIAIFIIILMILTMRKLALRNFQCFKIKIKLDYFWILINNKNKNNKINNNKLRFEVVFTMYIV